MLLGLSEDAKDGSVQIHFGSGQVMERSVAAARIAELVDRFQWRHAGCWISSRVAARIAMPQRSQSIFGGNFKTLMKVLAVLQKGISLSTVSKYPPHHREVSFCSNQTNASLRFCMSAVKPPTSG
jgi:hypothetical protein